MIPGPRPFKMEAHGAEHGWRCGPHSALLHRSGAPHMPMLAQSCGAFLLVVAGQGDIAVSCMEASASPGERPRFVKEEFG